MGENLPPPSRMPSSVSLELSEKEMVLSQDLPGKIQVVKKIFSTMISNFHIAKLGDSNVCQICIFTRINWAAC